MWVELHADEVNAYLKRQLGDEFSAKDFRTWNATVLAAVALAASDRNARSRTARQRTIREAVHEVAELLGNTPAVARRAYIDPRIFDRYLSGWTIAGAVGDVAALEIRDGRQRVRTERAVMDLLADDRGSSAVTRIAA